MSNEVKAAKFIDLLEKMEDPRDNRGKRHNLSFIISSVTLAILTGRTTMSGIHRYILNKIDWLKDILNRPEATPVSRAQLPRIIAVVEWKELNQLVEEFFSVNIELVDGEWTAIDGKTLCGTITDKKNKAHENEKMVVCVGHKSQQTIYQRPIVYSPRKRGAESNEISEVRQLLEDTELSQQKVTLDCLHAQAETLEIINLDGGEYIVQVKSNQPKLRKILESIAASQTPTYTICTREHNRGRLEVRAGSFFPIEDVEFDEKWANSGFKTLIFVERVIDKFATGKKSSGSYYYLSNKNSGEREKEMFTAIREHWQVEVNNYVRDVTLKEDDTKTKNPNQGQIFSLLRTIALNIIKEISPGNVKKALDKFYNCPDFFIKRLVAFNFI